MRTPFLKLIALLASLVAASPSAFACSIFTYSVDGRTYFGANEDWTATDPALQTRAPEGADNGYVVLGWKNFLPRYVQAGINDRGLCFDWAAVPPQPYTRGTAGPERSLDFTLEVLRTCATVEEAVAYVTRHEIPHLAEEHIMFADARGTSCIIEYARSGLRFVWNRSDAQFMTNFHVTEPSLGWFPCQRYARMQAFFGGPGNKESRLAELLDSVHQEGPYPTVYSYLFDLRGRKISVFCGHDFNRRSVFSLDALMQDNRIFDISWSGGGGK